MQRYLILADFDQTVGSTFGSAKDAQVQPILGTAEAYTLAVDRMFGEGTFAEIGGLQNRSPLQVSMALLEIHQTGDPIDIETLTEDLNAKKLSILREQIGRPLEDGNVWPPPLPGFPMFAARLNKINDALDGKAHISLGIISSGHDDFINDTFAAWSEFYEVPIKPDLMVTQDTVERRSKEVFPTSISRRSKPQPLPLALGIMEWQRQNGLVDERGRLLHMNKSEQAHEHIGRIIYAGDDPVKDGRMAHRADIIFGLMDPGQDFALKPDEKRFVFNDWTIISEHLEHCSEPLVQGRPFDEVFFGRHLTHPESMYAVRHPERG